MKKKAVIWIILAAVFVAALSAVIVIKHRTVGTSNAQSYSIRQEVQDEIAFPIDASDRLCGFPATDYKADGNTVKIIYGDEGYITKTLGETDGGTGSAKYAETTEQDVDGRTVTFKGNDGAVNIAVWQENGFTYSISVNGGVDVEEMIEYIKATR